MKDTVEKRAFRRRKLDLAFNLTLGGEAVPAVVTDFSLSGMAIFIKGMSDLNAQVLDLRISDIDLNAVVKIIWTREVSDGLKVGVSRIGPLEGTLSYYRLSDLLFGIQRAGKTGVLHIQTGHSHRKIYLQDGEIVFSSSDREQEQLGAVLLASGKISSEQYQKALLRAQETGRSQGAVFVEMRYISPQELVQALHHRVEAVVTNLCNIDDARFVFREEPLPRDEIVMLKLNSIDLLYRGSKKTDCIDTFNKRYPHHLTSVSVSSETHGILDRLVLEAQDREVLSLINGRTLLHEILTVSPLKEEETLKSLYALFNAQLLDLEVGEEEKKSREREPAPEGKALDPELSEKIDKLYRDHKTLGYHGVLGLEPKATLSEIKHAYHTMAKEYHPDRYLLFIQEEGLREKLNVIFAYINEAYRALSKSGSIGQEQPRASAVHSESPAINKKTMAQGKYQQGRESLSNQDYENAMTFFGQAVYLDEAVPDYHYYYGIALLRNKKIKDAEASIRKAIHLSPDNADYFAELGQIYLKLGFMTRAKNTFDKALRINPVQEHAVAGMKEIRERQND